jgi:hypothetical protein
MSVSDMVFESDWGYVVEHLMKTRPGPSSVLSAFTQY